ncbi:MAG: LON peptidase substrate-binding domain-containing protein [Gemmatimonadaceae bacterium]
MSATTLPIFPLPLVLFPGVTIPLHIFEPRYRRMLADCLERDRRFGVLFLPEGTDEETLGMGGEIGCVAHIESRDDLPDGRSNITVAGRERFRLRALVNAPLPYRVGMIVPYDDTPEPAALLEPLATRVRERFERLAHAARTISDDDDALPDLPDDPALLGFRVASFIDLNVTERRRLLASTSPGERLRTVDDVLGVALDPMEQRAVAHVRAKSNGHGGGVQA